MVNKMKKDYLLLLLFIIITFIGSDEADAPVETAKVVRYHGPRRYFTSDDLNGKTYISLNILMGAVAEPLKLIFPRNKAMAEILSGISLYSPADVECRKDTNRLGFKLAMDSQNYIRGDVKPKFGTKEIIAYMYEACDGVVIPEPYVSSIIDGQYSSIDSSARGCFQNGAPFQAYPNDKNVMTLEVSGSHKCQVFMVLPAFMDVLDLPALPPDSREPINSTFAEQGEDFWWKTVNNESLPEAIAFHAGDVTIDMTKSTKPLPYFFRIGKDQPYPSLNFKFDTSCTMSGDNVWYDYNHFCAQHAQTKRKLHCTTQQYDLYVNLRSGDDCRIKLNLTPNGIKLTTKDGAQVEIKDATKSPTLVFARGKSKLYAKAGSHLDVAAADVCQIENSSDVPDDQFVLQLAPSQGSAACSFAEVVLLSGDVKSKIEVLMDREKAAEFLAKAASKEKAKNETMGNTTAAAVLPTSTAESASAGIPWYYIVGPILAVVVGVAIGLTVYCCIRHRRKKQKEQKKDPPPCSRIKHDPAPSIPSVETAIPVDEPAPKKKKTKKDKKKKKKRTSENSESKKGTTKPTTEDERPNHYEELPPLPPKKPPPRSPRKPTQDQCSAIRSTQDDPTVQTGSTQNPSKESVLKVERAKLKYRTMYGPAGFVNMNDPFDYHQNESATFESKLNFAAIKSALSPPLLQFQNFWSCIEKLSDPKRYAGVYVNSKTPGSNIYFLVRDCVADEALYAPFRSLANRILEPVKELSNPGDGEKKLFIVRVFVLAYEPLTMEVHYRGQCPLFLFNLFDCEECPEIGKRLKKNPTQTSRESWDTFLCRVKRTPIGTHQFLSYNGAAKVKNADEVNHMVIIRGEKKPNKLRECTRGCSFPNSSHPNNFPLEAELLGDPTIQTQTTQQPSSD